MANYYVLTKEVEDNVTKMVNWKIARSYYAIYSILF